MAAIHLNALFVSLNIRMALLDEMNPFLYFARRGAGMLFKDAEVGRRRPKEDKRGEAVGEVVSPPAVDTE